MQKTEILKKIILDKQPDMMVAARKIGLAVRVFTPRQQKLSVNPARIIMDFYGTGARYHQKPIFSDISFDILKGDRVGILGRNGAGKTTLLRVIAGILKPTEGDLIVNGEARGLFSVSYGMDGNATGLENIYLRGLQMGLNLKQLRGLIPDVVAFTELGDSIHEIFNTYSTGMQLRLAVAISTMIAPDILLMDEWIGSGDQGFRKKVDERMAGVLSKSQALILASHNQNLLRTHCNKGWVMDQGEILFQGEISDAISYYKTDVLKQV